ncbi:3-oxoacyl-[acyl-carrier-protein] synthase III C-terminal domain-containing protein [Streptomyces europaeiscabiei]|uniref:3-oxoacyl-[acyl-carrier-protein] synthase III C-terminal domain-containing protein n=1 Tax=Streptomyces europaeiscabiei TaxID=146819 RepID=UPI002E164486|nr:hypothetical protein OHB30_04735 [Streptomyces europaeiscabiei]
MKRILGGLCSGGRETFRHSADQAPSNVRQLGNTVTPSTLALLHADQENGDLAYGDRVCFSVVGSGPERGAFITPIRIPALRPFASHADVTPGRGTAVAEGGAAAAHRDC